MINGIAILIIFMGYMGTLITNNAAFIMSACAIAFVIFILNPKNKAN